MWRPYFWDKCVLWNTKVRLLTTVSAILSLKTKA